MPDWLLDLLTLLLAPALVFLNGFFVAAEFALVTIRKTQVEELIRQGKRGASTLHKQVVHLDQAVAATQLGITVASIGLGFVGEPALARFIEPLFSFLPENWQSVTAHGIAVSIAFVLITFMHVVFGELAPKAIALQLPVGIAIRVAIPLEWFTRLTRPIVIVMNAAGTFIIRCFGFERLTARDMVHSVDELTMLVEEVEEAGLLSSDQAEFVQNVFELAEKRVEDCMVPREKLAALELHMGQEQILETVRQGAHTRLPVCDRELDNIVGIVNTKDLFYLFSLKGLVTLDDAVYPALFLKPEQPIGDALRLFRKAKRPMALVRTGEGHVVGMLTLEDVLEEIVGDIEDEHDRPMAKVRLPKRPMARRPLPKPEPTNRGAK